MIKQNCEQTNYCMRRIIVYQGHGSIAVFQLYCNFVPKHLIFAFRGFLKYLTTRLEEVKFAQVWGKIFS